MTPARPSPPFSSKIFAVSILISAAFAALLGTVSYSRFPRINVRATAVNAPDGGFAGRWDLPPDRAAGEQSWTLFLRVRNGALRPKTAEVFLNEGRIGVIRFGAKSLEDIVLPVPGDVALRPDSSVRVSGLGPDSAVDEIRIKNYRAYSRGWVSVLVMLKTSAAVRGLSAWCLAALFLAMILLALSRVVLHVLPWMNRLQLVIRVGLGGLLGAAALLPLVSPYRVLIAANGLWLLVILFNAAPASAIAAGFVRGVRPGGPLRRIFGNADDPASGRKALRAATILVPLMVMLFFASSLNRQKEFFGGNYSLFLRIKAARLDAFEQLYLSEQMPLLFENSDFEKGTLENWTPQGEAFLLQPVSQADLDRNGRGIYMNAQGRYWIGSYDKNIASVQGDRPTGTLTSAPFVIRHETIGFLIGGGGDARRLFQGAALEVDGTVVLETSGDNRDFMIRRKWDVRPWLGRTARIRIVDEASYESRFRHVNADWFHYEQKSELFAGIVPLGNYDGQFNYFMAYDPFLSKFRDQPRLYYRFIDQVSYRYGRIGFPLLIKLFSGDKPLLYPKTILWLIVASHFFGALFLLRIILFHKQNPLWAFLYILVPGFHYSLHLGLAESISMALLLAALDCHFRGRPAGTVLAAAASLFFRETGVLVIGAIMAIEVFSKRHWKRAFGLATAVIPYGLWRLFLTARMFEVNGWKTLTFTPGDFTIPFSGLIDLYKHLPTMDLTALAHRTLVFYPILLALLFILAVVLFVRSQDVLSLCLLLYALVAVSLNYEMIWVGIENGARGTFEAFVFLILVVLAQKNRLTPFLRSAVIAFFGFLFVFVFFGMDLSRFVREALVFWR